MVADLFLSLFIVLLLFENSVLSQILSKEHRTQGALEKANDRWCFRCDSMEDGAKCESLAGNLSQFNGKCTDDKRICMVKRISMTTSTENSTSLPRIWLLQRNCTKHCEPGCIVIGERTKLHACTTCCEEDLCNKGSDANSVVVRSNDGSSRYILLHVVSFIIAFATTI